MRAVSESTDPEKEMRRFAEIIAKAKSKSPSNSWGKDSAGNSEGESTDLAANANRQKIKGMAGDGPSEFETSASPEGAQQASREYRDVYQEYQEMSEAVLDSEPIPLGHRQTIRRYFELIRPDEQAAQK